MRVAKPTPEEVQSWLGTNVRRIKQVRMLTIRDIARRMNISQKCVDTIWNRQDHLMNLSTLVRLANALEVTLAELVSRPDDMTLVDHRSLAWPHRRQKAKLKATQEQRGRQALLEALGLDE